jgi:copper(I)-binding protein
MTGARRCFVFFGLATLALRAMAAGAAPLVVEGAWLRQVPGSDIAAAYFTLRNTGTRPVTVVGIDSPAAQSAMIHATQVEGGQSRMRAEPSLRVAPGQAVTLAPGGRHIMLMGVKPLVVGQRVHLTLTLEDGSRVQVDALVRPLGTQ